MRVRKAPLAKYVVSPAALMTAKYLEKTFGTPYEIGYPLVDELVPDVDYTGKEVLIVHQQVIANLFEKNVEETGAKRRVHDCKLVYDEKRAFGRW